MKEAYLYERLDENQVRCRLCSHRCRIREGGRGICAVRENRSGRLISLVYGRLVARNCDPIEKKPLFHFMPGTLSFSVATAGCNLKCRFCQNADISQMASEHSRIAGEERTAEALVDEAEATRSASISYTYTEPTVFYELAADTSRLAAPRGLRNVFVTNGYMSEECLNDLHPHLHAANVDLKAFSNRFYREYCGARLDPVLQTLQIMKEMGVWLEVTTLLIPGLNDSPGELRSLARFLAQLDPNIPWHISRFHPTYRMTHIHPTPAERIHMARNIGFEAGLRYVYPGNLPGDEGEGTFCHRCGELLVDRYGFTVRSVRLRQGKCPGCQAYIPGVWED